MDQDREYIQRVQKVTHLVQGKWTLQILQAMRDAPIRRSQLCRVILQASKKSLRYNLRTLETASVVTRHDLSGSVPHVEYYFAPGMRESVSLLLDRLADLGEILTDRSGKRGLWPYAQKSISDWKNMYLPECKRCSSFADWGGLFK